MQGKVLAALCLMLLLGFCPSNAEARTWTDKSGKYSIDAEFVSLTDGQVTLKRSDGKTVRLALENLSKADQEQVRQLTSSVPTAKTDSQIQAARPATKTAVASAKPDSSKSKTFTEKEIRAALKGFEAVNGRCTQDTPEMVRLILGKAITLTNFEQCFSVEQAVAAIKKVFPEHKLVTYWPEHGFAPGGVPVKHGFIIYSVGPLLSFTAYGGKPAAVVFFDEKQTLERIRSTVQSAPHGKYVDVNRILLGTEKPKAPQKRSLVSVLDDKTQRIRFAPAGVWRKDWQTTLELADDGTGTLVIAGVRSPCPWTVEKEHFVLHFTGWGMRTCNILDADTFVEMPEKSMKWSRTKPGQTK
jgi:hypothetical protein